MSAPTVPGIGTVDPNPPIPTTVSSLTAAQKTTIFSYIAARTGLTATEVQARFVGPFASDSSIISIYKAIVQGQSSINLGQVDAPSIPNPISGVTDFLNKFASPNLWIRVAEFSVGFLMLAIAGYAIVKNTSSGPGARSVGTVKSITPVAGALRTSARAVHSGASNARDSAAKINSSHGRSGNVSYEPVL